MKLVVGLAAIVILMVLAIYSAVNIIASPPWALTMIAYSTFFIYMVAKDIQFDRKKVKPFTMIEMMVVITLVAILLSVSFRVLKPDRAAAAIKQVGGQINVWNAKAMASESNISYRMEFTEKLLEVYKVTTTNGSETVTIVHTENIISPLNFIDKDGNPSTSQEIEFNNRGEMTELTGTKIYSGIWSAKVNGFTGHLSYYE